MKITFHTCHYLPCFCKSCFPAVQAINGSTDPMHGDSTRSNNKKEKNMKLTINLFVLYILLPLILFSCNSAGNKNPLTENIEVQERTNLAWSKGVPVIDSLGCIHLDTGENRHICIGRIICSADTPYYQGVMLMMYIDSNLAPGENKAFKQTCGMIPYILADDSIETYIILHHGGGSYTDYNTYSRRKNEKFREINIKSFENLQNMNILTTTTNGVKNFTFSERYGHIYTFEFNGSNFDTAYINDIPYKEFKKVGFSYYNDGDTVFHLSGTSYKFVSYLLRDPGEWINRYRLDNENLYAGFEKNYYGKYDFIGYFPSLPYEKGIELLNGKYTLKTTSWYESVQKEERLHYFDGEKYVGLLTPTNLGQLRAFEKKQKKMHPEFHFEVFTVDVY
jgi:hypothetical protein